MPNRDFLLENTFDMTTIINALIKLGIEVPPELTFEGSYKLFPSENDDE